MADSKKYDGEQWEHSLRKQTTASEIIVPPTTIYADGSNITTYTIKGNTVQNGTPTPDNPVDVVGVGTLDSGQYKIPILNGQTTTPIYLGSTASNRQIKKLVLDGTENWNENLTNYGYRFGLNVSDSMQSDTTDVRSLCTHLPLTVRGGTGLDVQNVYVISASMDLIIKLSNSDRVSDLKTWLAQQYANGTPVTVWYVLVTAETATVNEPLMKIGDYADTLSNAASIPTTEGANSITVDTTVQPSEFSATWTGWHNASVKEKSENLFDKNNNIVNYYLASTNGAYQATSGMSRSIKLKISPSSVYSITLTSYTKRIGFFENEPTDNDVPVAFYNNDTNEYSQSSFTITSPASANYMVIFCYNSSKEYTDGKTINEVMSSVMVNTGSTALPYEPYWK